IPQVSVEQSLYAYPPDPTTVNVTSEVTTDQSVAAPATQPVALPTTPPPAPPTGDDSVTEANKLFDSAREAFKNDDYKTAQDLVNKAIEKLPSDGTLHEFRALTMFAQQKYKNAAAGLYAVLAAGPGWNWETMSALYSKPEVYTKQLQALEEFSKKNPNAGY